MSNLYGRILVKIQEPKQRLTSVSILTIPDNTDGFVAYGDAWGTGLGYVMMRDREVVAYGSRHLKDHYKNYPTHGLKLAAIIITLKIWQQYLYSEEFEVILTIRV